MLLLPTPAGCCCRLRQLVVGCELDRLSRRLAFTSGYFPQIEERSERYPCVYSRKITGQGKNARVHTYAETREPSRTHQIKIYPLCTSFVIPNGNAEATANFTSILGMWSVVPVETFVTGTLMYC